MHGFRRVQRLFWSPTGIKRDLIGRVERLVRPHSFYQSMSHRPVAAAESVFDNHEHAAWTNPFTGDVRTTGFWDLYDQAQYKAKNLIAAFDQPGFTAERTRELTGELDCLRPTHAGPGAGGGIAPPHALHATARPSAAQPARPRVCPHRSGRQPHLV